MTEGFSLNIVLGWYTVIAAAIIVITTIFAIYHHKYQGAVWGWLTGLIFLVGHQILYPLLLGWRGFKHTDVVLYYLSAAYAVLFFAFVILCIYNVIKKGEVVL